MLMTAQKNGRSLKLKKIVASFMEAEKQFLNVEQFCKLFQTSECRTILQIV